MFERLIQLLYVLPTVFQIVPMVEQMMRNAPGPKKREAAQAGVAAVSDTLHRYGLIDRQAPTSEGVDQITTAAIDAAVAAYNTLGVFKHEAKKEEQQRSAPEAEKDYTRRTADEQDAARRGSIATAAEQAETERKQQLMAAGWPGQEEKKEEHQPA